jgi:hypothetical protein
MVRRSTGIGVFFGAAFAWLVWLATVGWLIAGFAFTNLGVACPSYAGDNSGGPTSVWQWFPPGAACTYSDVELTPDLSFLLLTLMAVAWPIAWFALVMDRRRAETSSASVSVT